MQIYKILTIERAINPGYVKKIIINGGLKAPSDFHLKKYINRKTDEITALSYFKIYSKAQFSVLLHLLAKAYFTVSLSNIR